MFLEQQISILIISEGFVTLEIGVMMLKQLALTTGINYIFKYFQIENSYFK